MLVVGHLATEEEEEEEEEFIQKGPILGVVRGESRVDAMVG